MARSPGAGWVQIDFIAEVQHAMDNNNRKQGGYRQHCDECWLLIVASGGWPSGLFGPSEGTRNDVYTSSFDGAFFMEAFGGRLVELNTIP